MSICPHTGLSQPECSCPDCLTEQIRRFQPALLETGPAREIPLPSFRASERPPAPQRRAA